MQTSDFDFDLPKELIAQHPLPERGASAMLCVDGSSGALEDAHFDDLPGRIRPGDVVVFNDTRVVRARLKGLKDTGGQVEVLVERVLDERHALGAVRASHPPKPGSRLLLGGVLKVTVLDRPGEFYRLRFDDPRTVYELLEARGSVPLPPYIERDADESDIERYQTVYARAPGAVAAPTAGLHFDARMLERLAEAGAQTLFLTLHVGAGTFQPVRTEDPSTHRMHTERFLIPRETALAVNRARREGRRIMAVGTTALRALEAASAGGEVRAGGGETALYILPGYRFRVVNRLLTNFHLPRSTLFMLVCAFGGTENLRRAYGHAIEARYRFFSYGDAMLIERGAA